MNVFLAYCDEHNITEQILQGLSYDRAHIESPSNFIDWETLATMMDRAGEHFTEQEVLELSVSSYRHPLYALYRTLGRLRFNLAQLLIYLLGPDGAAPTFYPLSSELLNYDPGQRNLKFRLTLNEGLRPSHTFFKILEGQTIGIPEVMGYGKADVIAEYVGNSVTLSITLPEEKGLLPFIRKLLMFPFDAWHSAKALQLTLDTLIARNRELEDETRKLSEAKAFLRVQKEQLDLLDKSQSMVFFTLDLNLEPLYYSESAIKLLGYTAEEATNLPSLTMVHESSREMIFSTLATYLEMEKTDPFMGSVTIRILSLRKDQTTFWSENYVSFLRDKDGNAIGLIGVMVDIDERVEAEKRQEALELELRESHQRELVGRVAGGIAHDFNNSLQAIIGFSEILETNATAGKLDRDQVLKNNQQVLKAATGASELVRQLLALGRRQTLSLEVFDVADWLEECHPIVRTILGSNIDYKVHVPPGLTIEGDTAQLERVVANLALNAKDAMNDGGEFCITAEQEGSNVEILFQDTGVGIPEAIIEQIFEPFFTSKESHQGSGLGLAVTSGIVAQHSGNIKAESQEGVGTKIKITLPFVAGEVSKRSNSSTELPELKQDLNLLVVDDREVIRELVGTMLKDQSVNIIEAQDGVDAVKKFQQHHEHLDLVLMDIVMPGQNGDKAAGQMKEVNSDIPVIFMTGYAGEFTDLNSFHNKTVIKKPFNRRDLFNVLASYQ